MSWQEPERLAQAFHAPVYLQPDLVLRMDVCLTVFQASVEVTKGCDWRPWGSDKLLETGLCSGGTTLLSVTNKTMDHAHPPTHTLELEID